MKSTLISPRRYCIALTAICVLLLGLSGCVSISPAVLAEPGQIREAVQDTAKAEDQSLRNLASFAQQAVSTDIDLQKQLGDAEKAAYLDAIEAGRNLVLEEFDDLSFRLINLGLTDELSKNGSFVKLQQLEEEERDALDIAIAAEFKRPSDLQAHGTRLSAQLQWEATYRYLVEAEGGARADLIVGLAAAREKFRQDVNQRFDGLMQQVVAIEAVPTQAFPAVEAPVDAYLAGIHSEYELIDQGLVDLDGSLRYETSFWEMGKNVLIGVGKGLIQELNQQSLPSSLLAQSLSKKAPGLTKEIQNAVQELTNQAASAISSAAANSTATAAASATNATAAKTSP